MEKPLTISQMIEELSKIRDEHGPELPLYTAYYLDMYPVTDPPCFEESTALHCPEGGPEGDFVLI